MNQYESESAVPERNIQERVGGPSIIEKSKIGGIEGSMLLEQSYPPTLGRQSLARKDYSGRSGTSEGKLD